MPKLVLDFSNLIGGATYAGWNGFFDAEKVLPVVPVGHVSGKVIKIIDTDGAEVGTIHVGATTADLPVSSAPELDPSLFYLTGKYGVIGTTGFVLRLDSGPSWPGSIVLPTSMSANSVNPKVEIPPGSFNFVPESLAGTVIAYRNAFFAAIQTNLDKSFSEFDLYENAAVAPTIFGHFEASNPSETIPTFTGRQMLNGTASFDHFDFEVIGSSYADDITGNTGINTFIGTLGSDSLTGKGKNDTFDYTDLRDGLDLPVGFDGFDPGSLVLIDGGAEDKTSAVNKGRDLLKLPGSANDYNIELDIDGLQTSNPIEWNKTLYDIVSPKSPEPPGAAVPPIVTMRLKDVEWVTFEEPVDNVVTPHLGNVATEALTLAAEVYGLRPTLGHAAEDLAYETFNSGGPLQSYNPNVASLARKRGWHALEAIELGIKPADYDPNPNTLKYSLHNGFYAAYKPSDLISIVSDTPEANALVLTGMLKGQRTLAISFRGTDQFADMAQFGNFSEYYDKFKPLIQAVDAYIADPANQIQQVLVSGHSLGAGVVQYFMHDHPGAKFRAYTDGSPGSDHPGADSDDPRITNIIRTDDAVTFVPDITAKTSNPISKLALVGLTTSLATLASAGGPIIAGGVNIGAAFINDIIITAQRKFRQGGEIFLNSPISDDFSDLLEHDKASYVNDMANLFRFADDLASPFATHGLAEALRADAIYSGAPVHLVVGRSTPGAGRDNGDSITPARDDDFALGGLGSDAFYFVKTDRISSTAAGGRIIDGGEGFDVLYLIGRAGDYIVTTIGEKTIVEQKDAFYLFTGAKLPVAVLYRMEKIDFVYDNAPILLGAGPTIHTAAPGATTLNVNPSFDVTEAGSGVLIVNGTPRNDRVMLGPTKHEVFAGDGDDVVTMKPPTAPAPGPIDPPAPEDNVILHGEGGNDFLSSGSGDDLLLGDAGDDTLSGGSGINILRGGAGDDLYVIGSENDTADETGASGIDEIATALAIFVLSGAKVLGAFENLSGSGVIGQSLTGNALANKVTGGAGDDALAGAGEADILDGGAGVDAVSAAGSTGVAYLDLLHAPGLFFDGTGAVDVILNIEGAIGGSGGDFLNGDHGANILRGGGATDAILGRGGNDAIDGGDGDDYLMGGDAYDPAEAGSGDDTIDGGDGTDIIFGMGGNDTINAGAGADYILAGTGNDTVDGGAGNDFLFGGANYAFDLAGAGNDGMKGGDGVDFIVGGQGADTLDGEGGDDIVYGGSGVDQVRGGAGGDSLFGEAGNDVMAGGGGFDYIYGGTGADTFSFRKDDSYDSVFDFAAAQGDRLRLDPALGVTNFTQFQARLAGFTFEGAAYTVLNFAALGFNDQITIKGIAHTAWTSAMVEFA